MSELFCGEAELTGLALWVCVVHVRVTTHIASAFVQSPWTESLPFFFFFLGRVFHLTCSSLTQVGHLVSKLQRSARLCLRRPGVACTYCHALPSTLVPGIQTQVLALVKHVLYSAEPSSSSRFTFFKGIYF